MDALDLDAVAELLLDDIDIEDDASTRGAFAVAFSRSDSVPDAGVALFEPLLDANAGLHQAILPPTGIAQDTSHGQESSLLDDIEIFLSETIGVDQERIHAAPSESTLATRPPPKRKPKRSPNYNPNKARNERRHELIYLRSKVTEMEQELSRLREKVYPADDAIIDPAQRHLANMTRRRSGIWEKIAGRQLNERRRAQRDNERLKIMLETQLKIATSLENLLNNTRMTKIENENGCGVYTRFSGNSPSASDAAVFEELRTQADGCYVQAKRLFDELNVNFLEASCRDARVREGEHGVFMEIFATDLLPFPLAATSKAAWQYFSHNKNKNPFRLYYERVSETATSTQDTIVENSALEMHVKHSKATFRLKQVLRRFIEDDQVVISFSAIAEPFEFDEKPVTGCAFREWGCMILTRADTSDGSELSLLKTCYFITPELESKRQGEEVGELTEFVLNSTSATMHAWFQMIENILLDESMDKASLK